MPIFMNYKTIDGQQGAIACANNLHVQLSQQSIGFGKLQGAWISWNGGVGDAITWTWTKGGDQQAPPSNVLQQIQQMAAQLRPYMTPMGKLGVQGVSTQQAATAFCTGAKIPTSMLQLSGNRLAGGAGWWI